MRREHQWHTHGFEETITGATTRVRRAPAPAGTDHNRTVRRWLVVAIVLAVLGAAVALLAWREVQRRLETRAPAVAEVEILGLFTDTRPVTITFTIEWRKAPVTVTHDDLRRTPSIWRYMHFEDWDAVPPGLREEALGRLFDRYEHLLTDPDMWDRLGARGWDRIPQPIRALAYRHMCEYWSGYYDVGTRFEIPPGLMADTLAAIVMAESWFDHRAVNENPWGNRDLGVAQASDGARARFRELHARGVVDVHLADEVYFDPWQGTRFVALWVKLLLEELGGDLDMAVRAYHRGAARALAREEVAESYLQTVLQRRRRYIRNQGNSPSWDYLWHRDRALVGEAWPWMRAKQDRARPLLPSRPLPQQVYSFWGQVLRHHILHGPTPCKIDNSPPVPEW